MEKILKHGLQTTKLEIRAKLFKMRKSRRRSSFNTHLEYDKIACVQPPMTKPTQTYCEFTLVAKGSSIFYFSAFITQGDYLGTNLYFSYLRAVGISCLNSGPYIILALFYVNESQ